MIQLQRYYHNQMENHEKQLKMLKEYITTLQHQNNTKNEERITLYTQIDRLLQQNKNLEARLNSFKNQSSTFHIQAELGKYKQINQKLMKQIQIQKANWEGRKNDLLHRDSQIIRLSQEKQKLIQELSLLKNQYSREDTTKNEVSLLQIEIKKYQQSMVQLESMETQVKNLRSQISRIPSLQNENREYKQKCVSIDSLNSRNEYYQRRITELENQNRELKSSNKSNTEISNLLSSKLSLQSTLRQLKGRIEWFESNTKIIQRQKQINLGRVKQLEKELMETKSSIINLKKSEDLYRSSQMNFQLKEKEMEALQQMIMSLKQNKKYLEKTLNEKDQIISLQESKIYTLKMSKFQKEEQSQTPKHYEKVFNENKILERQLNSLEQKLSIAQKQRLWIQNQNSKMTKEIQFLNSNIDALQRENLQLRYELENRQVDSSKLFKKMHAQEDDLRQIVDKLRIQLTQIRENNSQMQRDGRHIQDHCPTCLHLSMHEHATSKRQNDIQIPVHQKVIRNEGKSHVVNQKDKWENLQRKIIKLRHENDYLKKQLFD